MVENKCTSCKKKVVNDALSSSFICPGCGDKKITRCSNCRKRAISYTCSCGHEGP